MLARRVSARGGCAGICVFKVSRRPARASACRGRRTVSDVAFSPSGAGLRRRAWGRRRLDAAVLSERPGGWPWGARPCTPQSPGGSPPWSGGGGVSMSLAAAMPRCERRGGGSAGFALKANGANGGSAFKYRTRKSPEGVAGIARFLIGYICCLPDTSEERQDSVYKVAT